jgi:predicted dehydrogenase
VENPTSDIVAIADLDQDRLDYIQSRYPNIELATNRYQDFFDMDLDAVVISTPPQTHFEIGKECLLKGLHVLIEKPLTLNSQDAMELIRIAEKQDLILMVGHTFEYNPAVHTLKEMIGSGELGEIHYIDAVRVSLGLFQTKLNVIWDLAPHDISIILHLLEKTPLTVSAQGVGCIQPNVEDIAYTSMYFDDDILTQIRSSWLDPHKTRRITVVGSKKMVVYDDVAVNEKIKVYDKRVNAIRQTDTYGEFQFAYHYGDIVSPYIHMEEPLRQEIKHFLECIRENKKPLTDGYNGLRVVRIIEAAQESLRLGVQKVPIEFTLDESPRNNGHNGDGLALNDNQQAPQYSILADITKG